VTFDDARAAKTIHDKGLMRSGLSIEPCKHRHEEQDGQNHQSRNNPYTFVHKVSFESFKSSQRRTYATPLSYRVTTTSAPLEIARRRPGGRVEPACEKVISPVPPSRMGEIKTEHADHVVIGRIQGFVAP
jgi:hypothetical protein